MFSLHIAVENFKWRTMCDQDVGIRRNEVPVLLNFSTSFPVESPVEILRLYRRSPDFNAIDIDAAVIQVMDTRWNKLFFLRGVRNFFKIIIMIPTNENFMRIVKACEPVKKIKHFIFTPGFGTITRM